MIDLRKELGKKYDDIEKCGFIKDLEDLIDVDALINIDLDDVKEITKGEIVGSISTITDDCNSKYEINRISDKTPTECLLNVGSSRYLKLSDIDLIIDNIRKLGTIDMNIILGTTINEEMKGKYKVQALFAYNGISVKKC